MEKEEQKKKVNMSDRVAVYLICAMILVFTAAFFAAKKKDFSESENRYLAKLPEAGFKQLKEGKFTEGLEKYVTDHFPEREKFLSIVSEAERMSGRKQIGDIYLAKDGSLIQKYQRPENADKDIAQFTKLCDAAAGKNIYLMLVPTAVSVREEMLPDRIPEEDYSQMQTIEEIYAAMADKAVCIDVMSVLKEQEKERKLYYALDHHWTTYGAYAAYTAYCHSAGLTAVPMEAYEEKVVTDSFRGTLYSKLADPYFGADEIVAFYDPEQELTVTYEDTGEISDSLYAAEYLDKKDKYSYFLNNIHPLITIVNGNAPEGAAAVIKDSYANCFIPFLTAHYRTLYVFDTRYYKGGPSAFINEHEDIKDVLILYNMNTLDTDAGIGGIY